MDKEEITSGNGVNIQPILDKNSGEGDHIDGFSMHIWNRFDLENLRAFGKVCSFGTKT